MANRRLARASRAVQKKKAKASKKDVRSDGGKRKGGATRSTFYLGAGPGITGNHQSSNNRLKINAKLLHKANSQQGRIDAVTRRRSALRKQQQIERMTLKEHMAELERRKLSIRKGDSAKQERRELAKYIRQLKEEQKVKHAADLANVEEELRRLVEVGEERKKPGAKSNEEDDTEDWVDVREIGSDDSIDEDGLHDMFAHLIA